MGLTGGLKRPRLCSRRAGARVCLLSARRGGSRLKTVWGVWLVSLSCSGLQEAPDQERLSLAPERLPARTEGLHSGEGAHTEEEPAWTRPSGLLPQQLELCWHPDREVAGAELGSSQPGPGRGASPSIAGPPLTKVTAASTAQEKMGSLLTSDPAFPTKATGRLQAAQGHPHTRISHSRSG